MLDNRVFRLITTVGIAVILTIVAVVVMQFIGLESQTASIYIGLFLPVCVGIIYQLFWDFLSFGFLNGKAGRIIKLVIFYIVFAAVIAMEFGMFDSMVNMTNSGKDDYFPKLGAIGKSFMGASLSSGSGVVLAYTIFARDKEDHDEIIPFLPYIGYVGSLLICFILALIPAFANSSPYIAFGLITAATVIYTILFGLPFDYDDESVGLWDIISDKFSSSSGRSRSSYGYKGGGSSSSTNNYSGSSSSDDSGDDITLATDSDIRRAMENVARNICKYDSCFGGVSIEYQISVSVGYSKVVFTVKYHISGGDSIHDEYELNQAKNEISNCFSSKGQEIVDGATAKLSDMYLPRDMSVEVKDGGSW
jgi:hypothetical protein